ncbi:MAG: FAD-dependent oxidoreductase [Microcystis aeruginosa L211-07]|jgi:sulfide:quinone oxidoreductase|nr:FAD-dependent oxidoreductase [Microcystis aeruginosa L211-07]
MAKIVIMGAGLGGLPTAYELRHLLSNQHTVTLISETDKFTFIPGLIRVALDLAHLDHIQLDLAPLARQYGIELVQSSITELDPQKQTITLENGQIIDYDYGVIATGASLDLDAIAGLGPHGGYTQSVCTPAHALQARTAWRQFLANPGALVIGAAPGAGCFGPAYEFALMADWILRRRGLREKVSITYVTPEPYPGHLGVEGVENARELTADLFLERGIEVIDNAEIKVIEENRMILADGQELPFSYSMVLPAFRGVKFVQKTADLSDNRGFIATLPTGCHPRFSSLYAIGVSVRLESNCPTAIPIGLPKSGQMTEAMGLAVAHNIAVALGELPAPQKIPTLEALCFAEFGDTGIAYIAAPVLADPLTGKRRYSYAVRGIWVTWVKAAFEEYFLQKLRWGMGVPWFERWGLRLLFGLSLVVSLPNIETREESEPKKLTKENCT